MQMAVMRLSKQQLSKGWQTWLDAYLEMQRKKRILAASAGRLSRPALSVCLSLWRRDWEAALMKVTLALTLALTLTLTLAPTLTLALTLTLTPTRTTTRGS